MNKFDDEIWDRRTTAEYLKVAPGTLSVWACTKRYNLKWHKVGRKVVYKKSDVLAFIEQQTEP